MVVTFRGLLECFMGLEMKLAALGFQPLNHKTQSTFLKTKLKCILSVGVFLEKWGFFIQGKKLSFLRETEAREHVRIRVDQFSHTQQHRLTSSKVGTVLCGRACDIVLTQVQRSELQQSQWSGSSHRPKV